MLPQQGGVPLSPSAQSYALLNMGQALAQAGGPSPYKQSFIGGIGQGAAGFGQGLQQYQQYQRDNDLFDLQKQDAEHKQRKLELETKKFEQDTRSAEEKQGALVRMAQTPPKNWTSDMMSWQNLVLTDPDSAAKWYEPKELETITEYQGGQQRTTFVDPYTGDTVKAGDWAPRWQPQQAPLPYSEVFTDDKTGRRYQVAPDGKRVWFDDGDVNKNANVINLVYPDGSKKGFDTASQQAEIKEALSKGAVEIGFNVQSPSLDKLTEDQGKAATQLRLGMLADAYLDQKEQVLTDLSGYAAAQGGTLGNYFKTPEYRQAEQQAAILAEAYYRAATGAAAPESELGRMVRQIVPVPGDDAGTIALKRQTRKVWLEAVKLRAGPGGQNVPDPAAPPPVAPDYSKMSDEELLDYINRNP